MKTLLILILFYSCAKTSYTPKLKDQSQVVGLESLEIQHFDSKIDMMIFFIWPKDLNFKDEPYVKEIIKTSKNILERKEVYLEVKKNLEKDYLNNNCECHLYYDCPEGTEADELIAESCQMIEDKKTENQELVIAFYQDYESIKNLLSLIRAELVDIGMDDDYNDIGNLNLKDQTLKLNKVNIAGLRVEDFKATFKLIKDQNTILKLSGNLSRELSFKSDVDMGPRKNSVIFQGEIELSDGRSGLIYWEHLK